MKTDYYIYNAGDLLEMPTVNDFEHFADHSMVEGLRFYDSRIETMYYDFYNTQMESYQDVIDTAFFDVARRCADQKLRISSFNGTVFTSEESHPKVDMTDQLPKKLFFTIEGETLELDVIQADLSAMSSIYPSETEPETIIPYWKDGEGKYHYIDRIRVCFMVSAEQTAPLCAFWDTFVEKAREEEEARIKANEERQAAKQAEERGEATAPAIDLVGTWHDPTRYNVGVFTFREDGTGVLDWNGNGSSTDSFTYSVSGNTITCQLARTSFTLTINGDSLKYGGSKYVKK